MIDPITKAEFINEGANLKVTYFTGEDYEQVTEIFDLPGTIEPKH